MAAKLPIALKFPIDRIYAQVEKSVCPPAGQCDITLLPSNSVAMQLVVKYCLSLDVIQ